MLSETEIANTFEIQLDHYLFTVYAVVDVDRVGRHNMKITRICFLVTDVQRVHCQP